MTFRIKREELPTILRLVHCIPEDIPYVRGFFDYLTNDQVDDSVKREELRKITHNY